MSRTTATILAAMTVLGVSMSTPAAYAADGPSCNGVLAMYANPNNGFIIHNIVMPTADELGITVGAWESSLAKNHSWDLETCIP
jgi:hypothetical protein